MDLFDSEAFDELGVPAFSADAPLAVRMRPSRLEEVVGQPCNKKPETIS